MTGIFRRVASFASIIVFDRSSATSMSFINLERYGDAAALVGRLFFSSMFLAFGYGKLTAFGGTSGYMASLGLPAPALFTLLAIIIEIGGGLLMLAGYQTRLV